MRKKIQSRPPKNTAPTPPLTLDPEPADGGTRLRERDGGTILTVLTFGLVLSMIVGSAIRWGMTEKKINTGHILRHQAKNAAESLVEYGFADLIARFTRQTSFPPNELHPSNSPLGIPDSFDDFVAGTPIVDEDAVLTGGMIPPGEWRFINPNDPANEFDPLRGKRAFVREIEIYGKARAYRDATDHEVLAYTRQRLQVRDAPLFGHAMFYNMDLELHPGPTMNIYGPVHSNVDMYFSAGNSITFHEGVAVAGKALHGLKKKGTHAQTGNVYIKDENAANKNMYIGGDKSTDAAWLDNRSATWREDASQRWDGYLQDEAHGVPTLNPVGIDDYVPDDPYTPGDELLNHAYSIIEPLLPAGHPDRKPEGTRKEKYAYKAGLIMKVEANPSFNPALDPPEAALHMKAYKYDRTNSNDPKSDPKLDAAGDPILLPVDLPSGVIGDANSTFGGLDPLPGSGLAHPEGYSVLGSAVVGGMYDHREDTALHMFSLDVGKLKDVINAKNPADFANTYDVDKDWNGVVYVEFPTSSTADASGKFEAGTSGGRADKIVRGAMDYVALQTINASEIPNPAGTVDPGMSLATNAPLYLVGDFNANGTAHANDANMPDNNDEPPAAVASDSLTVLSNDWDDPLKGRALSSVSSVGARTASYTEVSAAILTGLKPTIPDAVTGGSSNAQSGGAHNFPRFLEKWSGKELTIRGSLVALFESEVQRSAMPDNFGHYYSPPIRDWGFNENFRNGIYPPGTPNARNFRRTAFQDMSKAEYDDAVANIWTGG